MTLLLATLWLAQADTTDVIPAPDEPFHFIVTADPLGQSDDRSATRLQATVLPMEPVLTPCRIRALQARQNPLRYVQFLVKLRPSDGSIRSAKVRSSSTIAEVDQCLLDALQDVRVDPPPKFADRLELNLTWAVVTPEESSSE